MENRIEDIQYCEKLFDRFYDVGSTEDGGVTRLGYSEQEDEMHAVFSDLAVSYRITCNNGNQRPLINP